jgi:multicomponent Na+:H+ antiporter subunit G
VNPREVLAVVLLGLGLVFLLLGGIGIVRFPDFFTRLHPAGKSETAGASLVILSLAVHEGFTLLAAKVVLVQVFIFFATPAASHAMGRVAYRVGLKPWTRKNQETRG